MAVAEHLHATPQAVAAHIAGLLRAAVAARGQASLARVSITMLASGES